MYKRIEEVVKPVSGDTAHVTVPLGLLVDIADSLSRLNPLYSPLVNYLRYERERILEKSKESGKREFIMSNPGDSGFCMPERGLASLAQGMLGGT